MGVVIKPVLSCMRTESGKLVVWHDRTINELIKRALKTNFDMEVKR